MRHALVAAAFILASTSAVGQTCQHLGNQVFCDNGVTGQRIGNQNFYSYPDPQRAAQQGLPSSSQDIGNTRFYNNGVTRQSIGNTDFYSNGNTRQQIGNTDFYSNGKTCQHIGNTTFCN